MIDTRVCRDCGHYAHKHPDGGTCTGMAWLTTPCDCSEYTPMLIDLSPTSTTPWTRRRG